MGRIVYCSVCGEQLEPPITLWRQETHECRFTDLADRIQQILAAWDEERSEIRQALTAALHDLTVPQHQQAYGTVPALRETLSTITESVKR
jgi:hypothetical protein